MDEIDQTCQYCGKPQKNIKAHERFCGNNPNNVRTKIGSQKQQEEPENEPEIKRSPVIISDIQAARFEYGEDHEVAWFLDEVGIKTKKTPVFIGNVHFESGDVVPSVLLLTPDGNLLPPSMIPGFVGMFSNYYEFPEEPIIEEPEPSKEPEQSKIAVPEIKEERPDRIITPPAVHAPEQKKKSLLAGIFGNKKEKEISSDTKEMLRQIADGDQT